MRVIVFSDSLGRPRPDISSSEQTQYQNIYGYLLRQRLKYYEVEIHYFDALDTEKAYSLVERQLAFRKPSIIILHIGINDCAPRIFKKNSRNIIFRSWFPQKIKHLIMHFIRHQRYFLTKYIFRNRVYVSQQHFRDNLHKIEEIVHEYSPHCHFLVMSILPTSSQLDQRSYGFNENVARYNAVLQEVFKDDYVNLADLLGNNPEEYLISDGIHMTGQAHAKVANYLHPRIMQIIDDDEGLLS